MSVANKATNEFSTELTKAYSRWRGKRIGQIKDALEREVLLEQIQPVAGREVLDVGCGDGDFAVTMAAHGAIISGVDADPAMIAKARDTAGRAGVCATFVEGAAESLPFPDAKFACVVAVAALCLVDDAARAIAEIARVLTPGGKLVIGDLGRSSLWAAKRRISGWRGNAVWRKAHFRTSRDLRRLVEAAGLVVVETRGSIQSTIGSGAGRRSAQPSSSCQP